MLTIIIRGLVPRSPFAWTGVLTTLVSVYLVARVATWLGMYVASRPWRKYEGDQWTERARLSWPCRRLGRVAFFLVAGIVTTVVGRFERIIDLIPGIMLNLTLLAAAFTGWMQANLWWERRLNPALALTPHGEYGAWILRLSVIGPVILLLFVSLELVSHEWNPLSLAIVAGCVVGLGVYLGWGWLELMRWSGTVRPASERLRRIASHVAEQIDLRPRAILEAALPMANAFAFVSTKRIGVTDAALAALCDDELATVCVHELAHLGEQRWVRAARLSSGFVAGLGIAVYAAAVGLLSSLGFVPFVLLYLGNTLVLITALTLYRRLTLRMELRADALVHRSAAAPGVYAGALEKLYAANMSPVVMGSRRKTHPDLYDRMIGAGVTPEYARPLPPPRRPFLMGLVIVIFGASLGIVGLGSIARGVPRALFDTESAALWTIGLDGGSPAELLTLWKAYDASATLSTLPDEIDSVAPDVNPSVGADGSTPAENLGDEGK